MWISFNICSQVLLGVYNIFLTRVNSFDQSNGSCFVLADTRQKTGSFSARHVDVPDLDLRFKDVSETFNKQQENYKQMKEMLKCISDRYQLSTNDSLSQCLKKIKEEHGETLQSHMSHSLQGAQSAQSISTHQNHLREFVLQVLTV